MQADVYSDVDYSGGGGQIMSYEVCAANSLFFNSLLTWQTSEYTGFHASPH